MNTTQPKLQIFDFIPADTLFCRDQRPLAAGHSFGRGANWPLPTVLHSAIRTALLRQSPEGLPQRKREAGHERRGVKRGEMITDKFQWLNLRGPFPVDEQGMMYFPIPRDLVPAGDGKVDYLRIIPNAGTTNNLPAPLTHLAASFAAPSKDPLADWVSAAFYRAYLAGDSLNRPVKPELWDSEHRIGVAIDPDTHTAAESKLYAAEHLRLRDGVKLRFAISEDPHQKEHADIAEKILQLGGEQRFGKVTVADSAWKLPEITVTGKLIKWVLLTPAIFIGGWLPGWIDENTGEVKLRVVNGSRAKRRHERDHTASWKYDPEKYGDQPIAAKLVAAVVGKPQVIGGWDDAPKPTHLAVPSGSIYYFEAGVEGQSEEEKGAEAKKLVKVLQGRCKSDFFGEKGLGLGICGTWREGSNR